MKKYFFFVALIFVFTNSYRQQHFDLLILNGSIIDGTGKQAYSADIGIQGDKITSIGNLKNEEASLVIDAHGLIISPGFIDVHTHCDRALLTNPVNENYIRQGVTSVIGGNCGGSPIVLNSYFSEIKKKNPSTNIGLLIGHNTVRAAVMGLENRDPAGEELDRMKEHIDRAMKEGALGLSTGLGYLPGIFSKTGEIIELNKVAGRYGGIYASHIRDQGLGMFESVEEAIRIGEEGGTRVQVSHLKLSLDKIWGETDHLNDVFQAALEKGIEVYSDQYPYIAGSTSLGSQFPAWSLAGGKLIERLKNPEIRARIKNELFTSGRMKSHKNRDMLAAIQIASYEPDSKFEGKTLRRILEMRGKKSTRENGAELAMEIVENGDAVCVFFLMDEKDIGTIMNYPYNMIASDGWVIDYGDGVPHPRAYGTFPRVLGKYVRDENILPLETALYKMSALPAQAFRIEKRGIISEGNFADIVIFDKGKIRDTATFQNPHQYPGGIFHVIVNGTVTVKDGRLTGNFGGRPLYGTGKLE